MIIALERWPIGTMPGDGKMAKYKDVIELKSDYHRVLTSHLLRDDGTWQQFMTTHEAEQVGAEGSVDFRNPRSTIQ